MSVMTKFQAGPSVFIKVRSDFRLPPASCTAMTSKRETISVIAQRPRQSRLGLSLADASHFGVRLANSRMFQVAMSRLRTVSRFGGMAASSAARSRLISLRAAAGVLGWVRSGNASDMTAISDCGAVRIHQFRESIARQWRVRYTNRLRSTAAPMNDENSGWGSNG